MAAPAIPLIMMAAGAGVSGMSAASSQKNSRNAARSQYEQNKFTGQLQADRASEQAAQYNAKMMMDNRASIISAAANAGAQSRALDRQSADMIDESSRRLAQSVAMAASSAESRGVASSTGSAALLGRQAERRGAREAAQIQYNTDVQRENIWSQYQNVVDTAKYANYRGLTTYSPGVGPNMSMDKFAIGAAAFQGGVGGFMQGDALSKTQLFNSGGDT